jgi:hypothetical protein
VLASAADLPWGEGPLAVGSPWGALSPDGIPAGDGSPLVEPFTFWSDGGRGTDGVPPAEPSWGELLGYDGDGWPPGYIGWGGAPMGELAFELFDLQGPENTDISSSGSGDPAPGGAGGIAGLPELAEPMLSAVLGVAAMGDDDCLALMAKAARSVARWQGVLARAQARFAELRPPLERGDDYSFFAADEIARSCTSPRVRRPTGSPPPSPWPPACPPPSTPSRPA